MLLRDVPLPTTPAATAALEVVTRFSPPALVHHCRRSYVFAAALAELRAVAVDHELLFVATMLHDLGLEAPFDSHTVPFEFAGGDLAWVFTAGAGWPAGRRERAGQIIVDHMRSDVDPAVDPEGQLLALATGLDISGRSPDLWPAELLAEAVAAWPRLDLAERFTACFQDQAARKPDSTAGASVRSGIAERMAANPLEQLQRAMRVKPGSHTYRTLTVWTGNTGSGTSGYRAYERTHEVTSGAKPAIAGSADASFRGDAARWNPEELLVAALADCHMLQFLHLCADAGVVVVDYRDTATGSMEQSADGGGRFTEVVLHPVVTVRDAAMAGPCAALHDRAHELCFVAASVSFPVRHEATVKVRG